eukprot:gene104-233_t
MENILFGLPFEAEWYHLMVDVCCLRSDFAQFPDGDGTEVGERGITLSGGQKTRVALARALYARPDVLLLDDVFSALDAHVTQAVWRALKQFQASFGATVVLTTHNEDLVRGGSRQQGEENPVGCNSTGPPTSASARFDPSVFKTLIVENGKVQAVRNAAFSEKEESVESQTQELVLDTGDDAGVKSEGKRASDTEEMDVKPSGAARVTQDEDQEKGTVSARVWLTYLYAGCGDRGFVAALFVLKFVVAEAGYCALDVWLAQWSSDAFGQTETFYIVGYVIASLVYCLLQFARAFAVALFTYTAGKQLHERLLRAVMFAPYQFFEKTPTGRILGRMAKDTADIDLVLGERMQWLAMTSLRVCSILIVITVSAWPFAVIVLLVLVFYQRTTLYYRTSARELRRIEAVTRGPVLSKFTELVNGLVTIRAFRKESDFVELYRAELEKNLTVFQSHILLELWIAYRLSMVGLLVIMGSSCAVLISHEYLATAISPGMAGLALAVSFNVVINLNAAARGFAQMEAQLTAVERLQEYSALAPEEDRTVQDNGTAEGAFADNSITFEDCVLRYRPELDPAVRALSLTLSPQLCVGICGRTGSGKSTLFSMLLRLVPLSGGRILIGGRDISRVTLFQLRRFLTIVPQDPVLFSGTVRKNVDIFNEYLDEEVWGALKMAQLVSSEGKSGAPGTGLTAGSAPPSAGASGEDSKDAKKTQVESLEDEVKPHGDNWSAGERQLICFARAVLRSRPSRSTAGEGAALPCGVLLLDEATSTIDRETDRKIQAALRLPVFQDKTRLVIAHRVATIVDADRILTMADGRLAEFDEPANLLANPASLFSQFVASSNSNGAS